MFCENSWQVIVINCFCKRLYFRCLTGFWKRLCDKSNLSFSLRNYNSKMMGVHFVWVRIHIFSLHPKCRKCITQQLLVEMMVCFNFLCHNVWRRLQIFFLILMRQKLLLLSRYFKQPIASNGDPDKSTFWLDTCTNT